MTTSSCPSSDSTRRRRTRLAGCALALAVLLLAGGPASAGSLAFLEREEDGVGTVDGLNGVRALALSPDGLQLYAGAEKDRAVAVFRRDDLTGGLGFVQMLRDGVDGVDGLDRVRAIAVSPDGLNVYVGGARDDALAVFARDLDTGALTFLELQRDGVAGVDGLDGVKGVLVSPDGAHVYAAGDEDNAVAVFARDFATGALTFIQEQRDGVDDVNGLRGAEALAMSLDGGTLYVAAPGDAAIAVFARDWDTGALSYVERQRDNVDGVDGLDGVRALALSSDDLYLYAAGKLDDAIVVFERDPSSGGLVFLGRVRDNVDGVEGLDGIEAIALSPDDATLYAISSGDDAVAVLARDLDSGALTWVDRQRDGVGTISGLVNPKALVVSPDGGQVYVAAAEADSILVFGTRCGDGFLDDGEQCDDGNSDSGDGCSAGCRRTCATGADCNDDDRCTEDFCRVGECASAHCGPTGAVCELAAALPALQTTDLCMPFDRALGRTIRQRLREAQRGVRRMRHRSGPAGATLMGRVDRTLGSVDRKATRLAAVGVISPDCLQSLRQTIDGLALDLHQALLRAGLCAG
jgi:cysteine-rich repeat protein